MKLRLNITLFTLIALAALSFNLWRCWFGVDLTDETFYLTPAWKLFGLGDRPFLNEINNAPRHSDLLNYYLIRPFLPFQILYLRIAATLVYAGLLLWLCRKCFGEKLGVMAGLIFSLALTYDIFIMPTWSYNWWARNFLILHQIFILNQGRRSGLTTALAGACLGVIVIAYNTLFLSVLVPILVFGALASRRNWLFYCLGFGLALLPEISYLVAVWPDFSKALHLMATQNDYSYQPPLQKLLFVIDYLLHRKELWFLVFYSALIAFAGKLAKGVPIVGSLLALFYVARQFRYLQNFFIMHGAFCSIGMLAGILLGLWAFKRREFRVLAATALGLAVAISMAVSSVNRELALFWALPALFIPFFGLVIASLPVKKNILWAPIILFLVYLNVAATVYKYSHAYFEVPPRLATVRLNQAPFQGLYTSPARAKIILDLEKVIAGKKFVLSVGNFPGALVFGQVRASINTAFAGADIPPILDKAAINYIQEQHRFPELIIRPKKAAFVWGGADLVAWSGLASDPYVHYRTNSAIWLFSECVRQERIFNSDDFEVFAVAPARVSGCIEQSLSESWKPESEVAP